MNNKQRKTALFTYNASLFAYYEDEALQQLLINIDEALRADAERADQYNDFVTDQFTITIGGKQTAFLLGGPQTAALHKFIQHIADENFYEVDFENKTVKSYLRK